MKKSDFVDAVYLKATGEVSTLSESDSDYQKIVQLGNLKIDDWAIEDDWSSLYDPAVNIGTISATDTYDLDSSIRDISNQPGDFVEITNSSGHVFKYTTVEPKRFKKYGYGSYVAKVGQSLKFNKAFISTDQQYGGTITVPAYLYPKHLVRANDTVPVDNPNWLVVITAAEWVRSDITLAQNYPGLVAEANNLLTAMKKANRAQEETVILGRVAHSTEW